MDLMRSLDELRDISRNSRQYIAAIETRERDAHRHPVAEGPVQQRFRLLHRDLEGQICILVPPAYERKQTLANAERFTTPELKELEAKVLSAEEKILELERTTLSGAARLCRSAGRTNQIGRGGRRRIGRVARPWRRLRWRTATSGPAFPTRGEMRIEPGRHPVIEKLTEKEAVAFHS